MHVARAAGFRKILGEALSSTENFCSLHRAGKKKNRDKLQGEGATKGSSSSDRRPPRAPDTIPNAWGGTKGGRTRLSWKEKISTRGARTPRAAAMRCARGYGRRRGGSSRIRDKGRKEMSPSKKKDDKKLYWRGNEQPAARQTWSNSSDKRMGGDNLHLLRTGTRGTLGLKDWPEPGPQRKGRGKSQPGKLFPFEKNPLGKKKACGHVARGTKWTRTKSTRNGKGKEQIGTWEPKSATWFELNRRRLMTRRRRNNRRHTESHRSVEKAG